MTLNILIILCVLVVKYAESGTVIVGGDDALQGDSPYSVSLQFNGKHFCGGSLITLNKVISAAHCFANKKLIPGFQIKIVAGVVDLDDDYSGTRQERYLTKVVIHPEFNETLLNNDGAVITVHRPFDLTRDVQIIKIAPEGYKVGKIALTYGWGAVTTYGKLSRVLKVAYVKFTNKEICEKEFSVTSPSQLCTIPMKQKFGRTCQGDSGGALICEGKYLCGITSGGHGCPRNSITPNLYTNVAFLHNWFVRELNTT